MVLRFQIALLTFYIRHTNTGNSVLIGRLKMSWSVVRQSAQPGCYRFIQFRTGVRWRLFHHEKALFTYTILMWTCHNSFAPLWYLMFFLTQMVTLLKGAVAWWSTEEDIPHYTLLNGCPLYPGVCLMVVVRLTSRGMKDETRLWSSFQYLLFGW